MIVSDSLSSEGMTLEVKGPDSIPEDDRKKAKMIWQMLMEAKAFKYECGWKDGEQNWRYWEGKQWERRRPKGYHTPVINQVYKATETFNGHIMDGIPDAIVRPRRASEKGTAERFEKILNWADDLNRNRTKIEMPVRAAQCTGIGVRRVDWDPTADNGRGAPVYEYVDEDHFFPSPYSTEIERCSYVLQARNVPMSVVRNWDSENAHKVLPGVWDGNLTTIGNAKSSFHNSEQHGSYGVFTTTDGQYTQPTPQVGIAKREKNLATLVEAWIRQDDGSIRYIVVANGIILQDTPSPYDDDEYPYVVMNVIPGKNVYGHSLVKFYKNLQKQLNESNAYTLDQAQYESDSPLVINAANLTSGRPTNKPGSVYVDNTEGGRGYYRLVGPGPDMKNMSIQEVIVSNIEDIAGSVDILRGDRPAGVNTLGGMEIVREAANVLVAKMLRHIMEGERQKNIKVINRCKQFMRDQRVVRITGKGQKDEYVEVNTRKGYNSDGSFIVEHEIPRNFEADVDFATSSPGGKRIRFEDAKELLQLGAVDQQYMLEEAGLDEERISDVTSRMSEQAEAARKAELEMQAAAHGGGQGAPQEITPDQAVRQVMAAIA